MTNIDTFRLNAAHILGTLYAEHPFRVDLMPEDLAEEAGGGCSAGQEGETTQYWVPVTNVRLPETAGVLEDGPDKSTIEHLHEKEEARGIANRRLEKMREDIDAILEFQRAGSIKGHLFDACFDISDRVEDVSGYRRGLTVAHFRAAIGWLADEGLIAPSQLIEDSVAGSYRLTARGLDALQDRPNDGATAGHILAGSVEEGQELDEHLWLIDRLLHHLAVA